MYKAEERIMYKEDECWKIRDEKEDLLHEMYWIDVTILIAKRITFGADCFRKFWFFVTIQMKRDFLHVMHMLIKSLLVGKSIIKILFEITKIEGHQWVLALYERKQNYI